MARQYSTPQGALQATVSTVTHVNFVRREKGPDKLLAEAEVVFGSEYGPLAGTKLVGFCVWGPPSGELYITFPSRAFGTGPDRRYFDYLRSVDGTANPIKRVKSWILEEYKKTVL